MKALFFQGNLQNQILKNKLTTFMKNSFKILLIGVAFLSLSFMKFEKKEINVVIDAGHGGHDFGAQADVVLEKDLVAEITSKIKALNKDADVKIHFTRSDDSFMELQQRTNYINEVKPDLAISLHINNNNSNSTVNGYEVFVPKETATSEKSKELAEKLISKFSKKSQLNNRGVKTAPYFILKKSEVPAMVVELGFISNDNDRNYLTSENGQTEIATTILDFVSSLKE